MIILKYGFILNALIIFLSSCSGSGGIIGGLIPAPKFLKGKVVGGTYYSAEGAFKVELPHPPAASKDDKYEWTYTKVLEFKGKGVIGVIFGTAVFGLNLYHAALNRAPV